MTVDELGGAVVVIKNMLVMGTLTAEEAAYYLWDLINEVGDSIQYKPGTSKVVDALIRRKAMCG